MVLADFDANDRFCWRRVPVSHYGQHGDEFADAPVISIAHLCDPNRGRLSDGSEPIELTTPLDDMQLLRTEVKGDMSNDQLLDRLHRIHAIITARDKTEIDTYMRMRLLWGGEQHESKVIGEQYLQADFSDVVARVKAMDLMLLARGLINTKNNTEEMKERINKINRILEVLSNSYAIHCMIARTRTITHPDGKSIVPKADWCVPFDGKQNLRFCRIRLRKSGYRHFYSVSLVLSIIPVHFLRV